MPIRTCIACRQAFQQGDLVRVRSDDEDLIVGPGPGRGAWVGPSPACVRLARDRRAFGRALRVEVIAVAVARLLDSWPMKPPACPHGGY